jgi:valyl-tRNA synthetase
MPFLTEELWRALYDTINAPLPERSIALTKFPQPGEFVVKSEQIENAVLTLNLVRELKSIVLALRKEMQVPEKESVAIRVYSRFSYPLESNHELIKRLAKVKSIEFVDRAMTGPEVRNTANFDVAVIYERHIDVAAERERLNKDLAKFDKGLQAAERQLNNPGFVAKAPAHIIDGLKKQAGETRALKEKTEAALAALLPEN